MSTPAGPSDLTQLDDASGVTVGVPRGELAPGTRIGRYRIIEVVGEGGMGRVYRAEQLEPVQRQVALKQVLDATADPLRSALLEIEAQALARVDHPAIARLYEVGRNESGEPFLAMEWVDGEPIDAWVARRQPERVQRIRLLQRVALGVHHAHQRGVVHRDIKPSNILVTEIDGRAEPRLIDFGIAASSAAGSGRIYAAGSRGYMAPEQADVRESVDVRSDVYALGMTLLAILAPDVDRAGSSLRLETLREMLAADTEVLRERHRHGDMAKALAGLPGDLRAILRKALATDPEQRYGSAQALAEDLDRLLTHRPVNALPHTAVYVARRFARRHRLGLLAGAAVLLALTTGSVLAVLGMLEARQAQQVAEQSALQAQREAARSAALAAFTADLLSGISPDEAQGKDTTLLMRIFERARQRIDDRLGDDPELLLEASRVVAVSLRLIGKPEDSVATLERALDRVQGHSLSDTPAGVRARRALVMALHEVGRAAEAQALAGQVVAAATALEPADPVLLAAALADRAWVIQSSDGSAALAAAEEAVRLAAEHLPSIDPLRLDIDLTLASLLLMRLEPDRAQALFDELVPRLIEAYGAEHPKVLRAEGEAAITLLRRRDFAAAERVLVPLLARTEAIFGPEHGVTMAVVNNLGAAFRQQGKTEEAAPFYERGYVTQSRLRGAEHPNTLIAFNNLALLRIDQGRAAEVVDLLPENLARARETFSGIPRISSEFRQTLARALAAVGRHAEALVEFEGAWQETVAHQPEDSGDAREIVEDVHRMAAAQQREDWLERWQGRPR
jgi:non-specific serine/threonine protein kinase/serine/threonine-protein kinase